MKFVVVMVLVVAGAAVIGFVGYRYFAPERATQVDQDVPAAQGPAGTAPVVVKQGTLRDGAPGHSVSGSVAVWRASDGSHFLRFEEYDQTQGPDVFLYLTPKADPDSTEEIEGDGLKVLVPGGAEGGESTLEGAFNVPLPAGFDPGAYNGLAVWCERFNTLFGSAPLA